MTGVPLWFVGLRNWRNAFQFRWSRAGFVRHYDLHRLAGIVAAPLLAMIAVTGLALVFGGLADAVVYGVLGGAPSSGTPERAKVPSRAVSTSGLVPLERLRRKAEETLPGACAVLVTLPKRPGEPVKFRLAYPESPLPNGRCAVHLDPEEGRVLWTEDERQFSNAENLRRNGPYPLHAGLYGGWPTRLLHGAIGLMPLLLLLTGLTLWRQHARSRAVHARDGRGVKGYLLRFSNR